MSGVGGADAWAGVADAAAGSLAAGLADGAPSDAATRTGLVGVLEELCALEGTDTTAPSTSIAPMAANLAC